MWKALVSTHPLYFNRPHLTSDPLGFNRQLQTEIDAMKRQRVAVQKQIRDQSDKHRGFLHEAETQA